MIEYLITTYGYPALFFGAIIEGEVALVVAGFAAYLGYLDLTWVCLVGILGSLAGDQFYFYLGRSKGQDFLDKRPRWRKKAKWIHRVMERHSILILMCFRFAYGFRAITPIVLGTSKVSKNKFLIYNAIGATAWALIFSLAGYVFGTTMSLFLMDLRHYEIQAILVIISVIAVMWAVIFLKKRRWFNRLVDFS